MFPIYPGDRGRIISHPKRRVQKKTVAQIMRLRRLVSTCEARGFAVLGRSSFTALLRANIPFIYPPELITHSARFSRVCSGIYLQWSPQPGRIISNSTNLVSCSDSDDQLPHSLLQFTVSWDGKKTWDHCESSLLSCDCEDWLTLWNNLAKVTWRR